MTAKTHMVGGVAAGLIYIMVNQAHVGMTPVSGLEAFGLVSLSVIGSLAPDIDIATSKLGRILGPASGAINSLVGHRTICHSPLLLVFLYILVSLRGPGMLNLAIPIFIGALSHLVLDTLNGAGIPLLWPLTKRFRVFGIETGGMAESILRYFLMGAVFVMGIQLFSVFNSVLN